MSRRDAAASTRPPTGDQARNMRLRTPQTDGLVAGGWQHRPGYPEEIVGPDTASVAQNIRLEPIDLAIIKGKCKKQHVE